MSNWTIAKLIFGASIMSGLGSAALMRSHLNDAHRIEVAKLDKACLQSVFNATQVAKKHKRRSPNAVVIQPR